MFRYKLYNNYCICVSLKPWRSRVTPLVLLKRLRNNLTTQSTRGRRTIVLICGNTIKYISKLNVRSQMTWDCQKRLQVVVLVLGPLSPRGAIGARHDGLPRQFSPLLPVVCHGLSLSEGFAGTLCDVITPALFRPAPSSTAFDCSL